MTTQTHALYRFYDATGTLLYVGLTVDPGARWRKHAQDKPWWHEVRGISMETYDTREEVRAAETRAIAVENPRHNVQRPSLGSKRAPKVAAHPPRFLVWLCATCHEPIDDGRGYVHVNMAAVLEVEEFWRAKRQDERDDLDAAFVSLADMRSWPDPAPWLAHHADCDPDPYSGDYSFDVARARTHAHLLDWTAHLMEKDWLSATNWNALIQRQAGVDA